MCAFAIEHHARRSSTLARVVVTSMSTVLAPGAVAETAIRFRRPPAQDASANARTAIADNLKFLPTAPDPNRRPDPQPLCGSFSLSPDSALGPQGPAFARDPLPADSF